MDKLPTKTAGLLESLVWDPMRVLTRATCRLELPEPCSIDVASLRDVDLDVDPVPSETAAGAYDAFVFDRLHWTRAGLGTVPTRVLLNFGDTTLLDITDALLACMENNMFGSFDEATGVYELVIGPTHVPPHCPLTRTSRGPVLCTHLPAP